MKKLFTNKNFIQKTIIAIVIVLLFTFAVPVRSSADPGGVLIGPIVDLVAFVGDVFLAACNMFLVDGTMQQEGGAFYDLAMVPNSEISNHDEIQYSEDGAMARPRVIAQSYINGLWGEDTKVPLSMYSPQAIFSGSVPAFDVNFIEPREWEDDSGQIDQDMQDRSIASALHESIAQWYVALRNLAIIALLIILLYVGIRIIVSSTASDKAKYKEFLKDWLIALCILFTLHYIMTFTVTVVNSITEAIVGEEKNVNTIPVIVVEGDEIDGTDANMTTVDSIDDVTNTVSFSFNTDIMGYARFLVQHDDAGTKLLYLIIYMSMVILTLMFTFTYIKRTLTIAFLTVIAPLIALTYPIDKIGDGTANGFNSWLKEYVYNILIQPFHLIIYTVFAGIAVVDLSATNPIYAILVLWFILQSEKLLRTFFGFNKASSAGSLASFAGGAAAMTLTQKLLGRAAHGRKGGSGGSGGSGKIRTQSGNPAVESSNSPGLGDFADSRLIGTSSGEDGNSSSGSNIDLATAENNNIVNGTGPIRGDYRMASSGILLPDDMGRNSTSSSQTSPEIRTVSNTDTPENTGRQRTWTQNDTRGWGQWIAQSDGRTGRFVRRVGNGARSVRNMPTALGNRLNNSKIGETVQKIPKPIRNTLRGVGSVAGDVGKRALRAAPRVGLGVVGASVGVAAGITGDDMGDILKYGAAGAGIGATLGHDAITGLRSSVSGGASEIRDSYNIGAHGLNATELANQRRGYMRDENRMNRLDALMPTSDGHARTTHEKRELLAKSIDYTEATGITEEKKLAKAMKLENSIAEEIKDVKGMTDQEKAESAKKRAMIAAQYAEKVDEKKLIDDKYVEQQIQSWTRGMTNPSKGINENQARKEAENMMRYVKKLKKVD